MFKVQFRRPNLQFLVVALHFPINFCTYIIFVVLYFIKFYIGILYFVSFSLVFLLLFINRLVIHELKIKWLLVECECNKKANTKAGPSIPSSLNER
ncbi:unnamed protein product [Meloidogyne enterolobii]|uniref:Uncharacterized protein n=2 Tax=Meloidogyne enterolobii TaxID=390850 RepID=A0ACB0Z490_MELEN